MGIAGLKNKIQQKIKNNNFFRNKFGFESGIDITSDNQVLYRKNVVIKNIVFVSNLIYTFIFTIISITEPSNWLLAALLFPVTFIVNSGLKKMINKGPDDKMAQTISMYVSSFYMFLSTIVIYLKLRVGDAVYLQECGYILLYHSLAVCAFYQDKKMLKNVFLWVFILVTILHFTVTYPILDSEMATDIFEFFRSFFVSNEFKDILIRTVLLGLFMLVLYVNVAMANYMQDERKKELVKRRQVQEDFTNVVTKIFDVTLSTNDLSIDERNNVEILAIMAKKLASLLGLKPEECDSIYDFTRIHIEKKVAFKDNVYINEDEKFESLRTQTELGSELISRLQLERKCEDIIRATFEGSNTDEFVKKMREIQNNMESQIILICDIYVSMRSVKSYKKAYNHKLTMNYLEEHFKIYFDPIIFDRFIRFNSDFENIYNEM